MHKIVSRSEIEVDLNEVDITDSQRMEKHIKKEKGEL